MSRTKTSYVFIQPRSKDFFSTFVNDYKSCCIKFLLHEDRIKNLMNCYMNSYVDEKDEAEIRKYKKILSFPACSLILNSDCEYNDCITNHTVCLTFDQKDRFKLLVKMIINDLEEHHSVDKALAAKIKDWLFRNIKHEIDMDERLDDKKYNEKYAGKINSLRKIHNNAVSGFFYICANDSDYTAVLEITESAQGLKPLVACNYF